MTPGEAPEQPGEPRNLGCVDDGVAWSRRALLVALAAFAAVAVVLVRAPAAWPDHGASHDCGAGYEPCPVAGRPAVAG